MLIRAHPARLLEKLQNGRESPLQTIFRSTAGRNATRTVKKGRESYPDNRERLGKAQSGAKRYERDDMDKSEEREKVIGGQRRLLEIRDLRLPKSRGIISNVDNSRWKRREDGKGEDSTFESDGLYVLLVAPQGNTWQHSQDALLMRLAQVCTLCRNHLFMI